MATPHNQAEKGDIAKYVIMPGDPRRATMIAENYLDNYRLVNEVRGILAYTGTYKGKEITVMASGMGMASMGIYSYELFKEYGVNNIIRVGTCGAYIEELKIGDIVIVESSYAETDYDELVSGEKSSVLYSSDYLNEKIKNVAREKNIKYKFCRTHCTDAFYKCNTFIDKYYYEHDCMAVEMEAYALFQNANVLNKQASCILTVSDSIVTGEETPWEDRQESFKQMAELALNSIL